VDIKDSAYSDNVVMKIGVPEDRLEELNTELQNSTSGNVAIEKI